MGRQNNITIYNVFTGPNNLVQHTQGFVFVLKKIYAGFVCTDQPGTQLEQLSSLFPVRRVSIPTENIAVKEELTRASFSENSLYE